MGEGVPAPADKEGEDDVAGQVKSELVVDVVAEGEEDGGGVEGKERVAYCVMRDA